MAHPRAAIRAAIVATLAAAPGLAGRVFVGRVRPTPDEDLPVVLVYTPRETAALATLQRVLDRQPIVALEIRVKATDGLYEALDDLAAVVEAAMEADPKFGGLAVNSWLAGTEVGLSGDAEVKHGLAVLSYQLQYRHRPGA